jgi:hypothetical protein
LAKAREDAGRALGLEKNVAWRWLHLNSMRTAREVVDADEGDLGGLQKIGHEPVVTGATDRALSWMSQRAQQGVCRLELLQVNGIEAPIRRSREHFLVSEP